MHVVQNFSIAKTTRLHEFIEYKNNILLKTVFRREPMFSPKDGGYKISIRSNSNDLAALELLFEKWEKEDKGPTHKLGLLDKIFIHLRAN